MSIDPFIGTGGPGWGAGSLNPGAQFPHGTLRLGPATSALLANLTLLTLPFQHYSGYSFSDNVIRGFSHTHLVGAGVGDYGNFGVMPLLLSKQPTESELHDVCTRPVRRAARFSHANESAAPGRYDVNLTFVGVSLAAAGTHAGVHEYRFADNDGTCALAVDVCHTAMATPKDCKNATVAVEPLNSGVRLSASMTMAGALTRRGGGGGARIHFVAELAAATPLRLWAADQLAPTSATTAAASASLGALLRVPCGGTTTVRAAVSFISPTQALRNLRAQLPANTTVAEAAAAASAAWNTTLSSVRVVDAADASADDLVAFSTALYRTRLAPSVWSEAGGVYLGMDGQTRKLGEAAGDTRHAAYTDMSLWDIHRTQLPWLSLTAPQTYADVVRSLQAMGEEGGDVPRWPLGAIYTSCMIGNHALPVVAEAVAKNVTGFNASSLYELLRRHATTPRPHASRAAVEEWVQLGFVPSESSATSASLTLAYAFDDAALASIARALGRTEDATTFERRSRAGVTAGWSAKRSLFCPRSKAGDLTCPVEAAIPYPFEGKVKYTEGDALQWLWFAPSNVSALVELFGSRERFVSKLDAFVSDATRWNSTALPNPNYWAGNEPDLLAPWLFAFGGEQRKTAATTRWLSDWAYGTGADGLPGNDDFGTLSAWLVWARLGLYPLAGSDAFLIGSPRFADVRVATASGGELRIVAHNASASNVYVSRAEINGAPLLTPLVRFADISRRGGSTLELWMVNDSAAAAWQGVAPTYNL